MGRAVSLIGLLLVVGLSAPLAGQAEEESGDWPDAIDYPPNPAWKADPPIVQQAQQAQKQSQAASKEKKRFLFFGKKKDKAPVLTEEQITRVGPRNPPAYSDPLLRIPVKLQTAEGLIIQPGIYMVRQSADQGSSRELVLTQKSRAVHSLVVRQAPSDAPAANSPITQDPKKPVPVSLEAQASPDFRTVTIVLKEGETRFLSDPIPTLIDQRPVISY